MHPAIVPFGLCVASSCTDVTAVSSRTGEEYCDNSECKKPLEGIRSYPISSKTSAGDRDWSSLAGKQLCKACYERYRTTGSLGHPLRNGSKAMSSFKSKPDQGKGRRCEYKDCKRPDESWQFYQVDGDWDREGQNWSALDGKTLCSACYQHFRTYGTLVRGRAGRPTEDSRLGTMEYSEEEEEGEDSEGGGEGEALTASFFV